MLHNEEKTNSSPLTNKSDVSRLIVLSHEVLQRHDEENLLAALPSWQRSKPRDFISILPERLSLEKLHEVNWSHVKTVQTRQFQNRLGKLLSTGSILSYFGAAPIPLAVHLGYLVGPWQKVEVYQHHHKRKNWLWADAREMEFNEKIEVSGMKDDIVPATGDVIIRISTSHPVNRENTLSVIPQPLAEYEISVGGCEEDILNCKEFVDAVAFKFKAVLDNVTKTRPGATAIHLFAAIPVGLAFRLGTIINPTMTAKLQTYQFSQLSVKKYLPAISLGEDLPIQRNLTEADRKSAQDLRKIWKENFTDVKNHFTNHKNTDGESWLSGLLDATLPQFTPNIDTLAHITKTTLLNDELSLNGLDNIGGFKYDSLNNSWIFEDSFLLDIKNELIEDDRFKQAGRLLIFHEAIHAISHGLTASVANQVGGFAKILEEIDYEADIWALLHEMSYLQGIGQMLTKKSLHSAIETAISTFWAFDRLSPFEEQIQIRRLNRYLNWYWQLLSVERASSFDEALNVLSVKPNIELAGPKIISNGSRSFYDLRNIENEHPELAAKRGNRIVRSGQSPVVDIKRLLSAFRQGDAQEVKKSFEGFFDLNSN